MNKKIDLELPLNKRTKLYRFFEILIPSISFSILGIIILLSIFYPMAAAIVILSVIVLMFVRAIVYLRSVLNGMKLMDQASLIDWYQRLMDLEAKKAFHNDKSELYFDKHLSNINRYNLEKSDMPRVNDVYNLVIIAAYKESLSVIEPTIKSVLNTSYDNKHLILCLAYEERGGEEIDKTAKYLENKYKDKFFDFKSIKHPKDLPNEVVGKGGNITYAAKQMSKIIKNQGIKSDKVLVTTLDADNRPHPAYFDYVTYEFIVRPDRLNLSYQPIALFLNNIWDVPAPIRVVASGNSFWNVISTARSYALRNFASHSQPLSSLEDMNFWSTRTVVEDGHQFWRSYFHFNGRYSVVPIHIPVYQDAVLSATFSKTLKDQFIQLRRWAYGVSDIPYVAINVMKRWNYLPKTAALYNLFQLIDAHVSQATVSLIVAFGGWLPLLLGMNISHNVVAHHLPVTISFIQRLAMVGLLVTIYLSIKILPIRPKRYSFMRNIGMLLQWMLMPITAIFYASFTALYSQSRLLRGKYFNKFDVTDKNTVIKD